VSSGAKGISAFIRKRHQELHPRVSGIFKRSSWGVKPSQNTNDNDEIGGTRMAQGATLGTVDVGGDGTKFRWGQHDAFLASCFGTDWVGDSLTMGNDRITFSRDIRFGCWYCLYRPWRAGKRVPVRSSE
jgi:hypothetical protein